MLEDNNHSRARLAAMYEISSRLGSTLELDALLNLVIDAILQLTQAERGFIILVNPQSGGLEPVVARNVDKTAITPHSTAISHTVVERVVASGQPVLTSNALEDNRFAQEQSVMGYQLRSIMCAPLRARGQVVGAAYVDNRFLTGVFTQADLDMLSAFAIQAAMALENARLFTQTDQALSRRVEELGLFQQIDRQLNQSLDLTRILSLALGWAVKMTRAVDGSLGLFEKGDGGARSLRLLVHHPSQAQRLAQPEISQPVIAHVLHQGVAVRGRYQSALTRRPPGAPVTQLAVPILRQAEVHGLILLESPDLHAFSPEDIAFVERLADRAAVAIENARLYAEVQAARQAQAEFTSVVAHELRAPLTVIKGYTELLGVGAAGQVSEGQGQLLQVVLRNVERMEVLIRDLSDLGRVEAGQLKLEVSTFALADLLADVVRPLAGAFKERRQTLIVDVPGDLPAVRGDRVRTGQILTNLLSNAHKYTPADGVITLRAVAQAAGLEVIVSDTGIGISREDQAHLFTRFFRAEDERVRQEPGWGLGLAIVKTLVEAQGGSIRLHSNLGQGSTFVVTLPAADPV